MEPELFFWSLADSIPEKEDTWLSYIIISIMASLPISDSLSGSKFKENLSSLTIIHFRMIKI